MEDKKRDEAAPTDVVTLGEPLPNGDIPFVRAEECEGGTLIRAGTAHVLGDEPPPEGLPGEVLHLRHLHDNQYEVTRSEKTGPAKVNSAAYRANWESIFGATQPVGLA